MLTLRSGAVVGGLVAMGIGAWVHAQDYPNKPIRFLVSKPGGGNDFMARTIGAGISGALGQQIIIDNRPSNLEGEAGARSAPDGYTILLGGASLWTLPLMQQVSYDVVKDFAAVTLIERSPNILVVHPSLPTKSVKELIALAKARPGELNFASSSADTRLAGELFKSLAGINIVNIAYSSGAVEYSDLVGGQVQMKFGSTVSVAPHVQSGRLKALAVTTPQQSALYPSLPPVAASLPGYDASAKAAVFVPAKTPEAIVNRLNQEIGRFLRTPEAKEKFANAGSEAVTTSPAEAAATVQADMARLGKLIKEVGMRTN